jgi:hypothetical protein
VDTLYVDSALRAPQTTLHCSIAAPPLWIRPKFIRVRRCDVGCGEATVGYTVDKRYARLPIYIAKYYIRESP